MEWRSQLPLEDDVRHGSLLNLALVRIAGSRLEGAALALGRETLRVPCQGLRLCDSDVANFGKQFLCLFSPCFRY